MDFFCASSFFCLRTIDLECLECCVQHQWFTQWHCSCVSNLVFCQREEKRKWVICLWASFVSSFFTPQVKHNECCVWFQCLTQICQVSFFIRSICIRFNIRVKRDNTRLGCVVGGLFELTAQLQWLKRNHIHHECNLFNGMIFTATPWSIQRLSS